MLDKKTRNTDKVTTLSSIPVQPSQFMAYQTTALTFEGAPNEQIKLRRRLSEVLREEKGEEDKVSLKKYNMMLSLYMEEQDRNEKLLKENANLKLESNISIIEDTDFDKEKNILETERSEKRNDFKVFTEQLQNDLLRKNEQIVQLNNEIKNAERYHIKEIEEKIETIKHTVLKVFEEIPVLTFNFN